MSSIPTADDLTGWDQDDLTGLAALISAEQSRRQAAARYAQQQEQALTQARLDGIAPTPVDGAAWVQPMSALDAYKTGDIVTHDGIRWASLTTPNVWTPGVSGWRGIGYVDGGDDDSPGTDQPMEYVQPTGSHDAYKTGDQVTYEGKVFEAVMDGVVWSPSAYPAAWKPVA
ncbi:carbohydrate-binding protein [Galactobacter sp.]|uniref:carbohydrate-binding protein n=1 Tax=Galactobacter sp. TaxID=2676125 RepID=UPI0025B8C4ED|nr:carbohydrate-binding protein [Galactobacter sp.]